MNTFSTYFQPQQTLQMGQQPLQMTMSKESLIKQLGEVMNTSTQADLELYNSFCKLMNTLESPQPVAHQSTKSCDSNDNLMIP